MKLERPRLDQRLRLHFERLGLVLERLRLHLQKLGLAPMLAARWCAQFEALLLELVLPIDIWISSAGIQKIEYHQFAIVDYFESD